MNRYTALDFSARIFLTCPSFFYRLDSCGPHPAGIRSNKPTVRTDNTYKYELHVQLYKCIITMKREGNSKAMILRK